MSEIVHITFEKLTGLKGTIDAVVECKDPGRIDLRLPIVYIGYLGIQKRLVFRQTPNWFYMKLVDLAGFKNYHEHFKYGTNFLIKEWSNGRGEPIKHSNSPN